MVNKTDKFLRLFSKVKMSLYFLITKYEQLQIHLESMVRVLSWKHCSSVTIPEAVANFLDSAHNNLTIMQ